MMSEEKNLNREISNEDDISLFGRNDVRKRRGLSRQTLLTSVAEQKKSTKKNAIAEANRTIRRTIKRVFRRGAVSFFLCVDWFISTCQPRYAFWARRFLRTSEMSTALAVTSDFAATAAATPAACPLAQQFG